MDKVKTEHVGRASTGHQPRLQLAACEICTKLVTPDGTLEPCRCRTKWCNDCIRKVFLRAIKEPAAMPPKCCNPRRMFLIHLALPGLSSQEAATYRDRFDEWSASVKIYCPNPRCSAFISERLRPHTGAQAQPVPDSQPTTSLNLQEAATNTQEPTTENSLAVTCPSCSLRICMNCKQKQHVNAPCSTPPDQPVRDLVQRAGYKLCPSCGTGIKRMYGCASVQCVCGKNMCWGCGKSTDDCADGVECEAADEEGMTESDEAFADESMDDYSTDDDMLDERSQQDDAGITQLESRLKDHESTASTTSMHQQQQGPSNQDTVEAKPSREQEGHQQLLDQSSSRQPLASTNQPSLPGPQAHSKEARKSQTSKESPKDPAQAIIDSDRRDARDMYFGEEPNEAEYNFPICDHQFDPYVDCQGDFGMTRNKYLECHHCWSRVKASRTRPSTGGQSRGGSKTPRSSSAPRQDPRVEAQSEYDARPKAYVCTQCGIMFCTNCTLATQAARHNALLPT